MKPLAITRSRPVVKAIALMIAFMLGFCAHALWVRRQEVVGVLNNLFLYYQD